MRQLLSDPLSRSGARLMRTRLTRLLGTDPLLTHSSKNAVIIGHKAPRTKNARTRKFVRSKHFDSKAGEGIRTLDVQLGKLAFYH